ncbi:cysteine--tRNA ligase [Endozoicomonas sp. GU-1]|uniref:cysteine--tRNA ligase n=1 Tax=Endozoicomonas sp. GU-1 TaxID=3009078 RepID=UPI0022B41224|nr:cysteine--tRNA ligase [Endozoicomonas sp. GU-1]WBA84028.1 cysteine--tRNA ligase [Endozoicomonas sp. GU-1]WBA88755.1 cysteine--tRNA ligase [Endozoicomonas sp. GU-1]
MQIYNSLTRKKEPFTPLDGNHVRMYVCGMTVYDYCHIGHARTVTAFDVVARYLRARGYDLTYVRNITDVDDKIIRRAAENGEDFMALTGRMIAAMQEDFQRLGNLPPDQEPKATEFVPGMVAMIEQLIGKGFAYTPGNGDVYYRVHKFADYGKLSGKVLEELEAGARIEVEEQKEDPLDFVLWKAAKPGEPSWPSPWGEGRPGWHIECSVMGKCCLGDTFDIHGGGSDLKFPHHENEIAQSEACNDARFVNTWMHSGAIRIDNVKMSKSLGNFFTIREVLDEYDEEVVRYFMISSHYRSPINYSEESLKEAGVRLERLYTALQGLDLEGVSAAENNEFEQRFFKVMDDDFNTAEGLAVLFELVRHLNTVRSQDESAALPLAALLVKLGGVLGILQRDPEVFLKSGADVDEAMIESMIEQRNNAKRQRDFAEADRIRDELAARGVILQDSREGTTWRIER